MHVLPDPLSRACRNQQFGRVDCREVWGNGVVVIVEGRRGRSRDYRPTTPPRLLRNVVAASRSSNRSSAFNRESKGCTTGKISGIQAAQMPGLCGLSTTGEKGTKPGGSTERGIGKLALDRVSPR